MKLLKIAIYILFSILVLWMLGNLVITSIALLFEKDVLHLGHFYNENVPVFLKIIAIVKVFNMLLIAYGLYLLIKILNNFFQLQYFKEQNRSYLMNSGRSIATAGLIGFLLSFAVFFVDYKYVIYVSYDSRAIYVLLAIIGLIFIGFSEVIKEAEFLKQENDLTI